MCNKQFFYLNADVSANAEISNLPFIDLTGTTYFVELLNGCFWTFKDKDLLCLNKFFTIFTVVKILAKFGTTWKMLNAGLLRGCVGLLFWVFKNCLRIFVMFANADMCVKLSLLQVRVLTTSFLQLFLLIIKVVMWSADYCFGCMRISGDVSGAQLAGGRIFWKLEKLP